MRLHRTFHDLTPIILALAIAAPARAQSTAFINGNILTVDDKNTVGQALLVTDGKVVAVGTTAEIRKRAGNGRVIDLQGKTVIPALINTHGHPGFQRGTTYVASNFNRDTVINDLNRALYFGIAVVQSQGIEAGDVMDRIRADQNAAPAGLPTEALAKVGGAKLLIAGRGIGAPNAGPGGATYAGIAYEITTEDQAHKAVEELAARKVDIVKIWVDDRNGRAPRLSSALYRVIISDAHKRGLRVNAHVFYHVDAVDLVDAGIDGLVHEVRDTVMSDELIAAIVKKGVYVNGNLSSPERPTHAGVPKWLTEGDPMLKLLRESVPAEVIDRMTAQFAKRDPKAAAAAGERYDILKKSTAKLTAAGANMVLGADTGLEDHLFGLAEQLELQDMVDAGMTPAQGLVASTRRAAEYLHLADRGSLAPGKRADLLVLDGSPLDDITNTRRIARMFINGVELDRAALRQQIKY